MANHQTTKRGTFEFHPVGANIFDSDGTMEVTSGDHGVTFSVTEEKAVDSYNEMFTCKAVLPRVEAERLRDWLTEILS